MSKDTFLCCIKVAFVNIRYFSIIDTPQQKYGQLLARIEAVVVPEKTQVTPVYARTFTIAVFSSFETTTFQYDRQIANAN